MPVSSCFYAGYEDSAEKYSDGGLQDRGDAF